MSETHATMKALGEMRGQAACRHRRMFRQAKAYETDKPSDWPKMQVKHPWQLRQMQRLERAGLIPEGSYVYRPWPKGSGFHSVDRCSVYPRLPSAGY